MRAGDIIAAARDANPGFTRQIIPPATAWAFLRAACRQMLGEAQIKQPDYLLQRVSIGIDTHSDHLSAGAGTEGGFAAVEGTTLQADLATAGLAARVTEATSTRYAVASASTFSITVTGAGWSVNAHTGKLARLVGGLGKGQERLVATNTSDTLYLDPDGDPLDPVPGATGLLEIANALPAGPVTGGEAGLALQAPARASENVWPVKLDENGVPYIDYGSPIPCRFGIGVPLPEHNYIWSGDVFYRDRSIRPTPLFLINSRNRTIIERRFPAYVQSGKLFLAGAPGVWDVVRSIDVRFAAPHPAITSDADIVLLRSDAEEALIQAVALRMGNRAIQLGIDVDLEFLGGEASAAQERWLNLLTMQPKVMAYLRGTERPAPIPTSGLILEGTNLMAGFADDETLASDSWGAWE